VKKVLGIAAALAVALTACGAPAPADESADGSGGGLSEPVGITGDWTIEVLDADGDVAESLSFRNAFVGAQTLAEILIGSETPTAWQIRLEHDALGGAPALCNSGNGFCFFDATASWDATAQELVVAGSTTVDNDSEIIDVGGLVVTVESGNRPFSDHVFQPAEPNVPVAAGQVVQAEIRYSFG
jgi:hypothetical protein